MSLPKPELLPIQRRTYANPPNPAAESASANAAPAGRGNAIIVGSGIALFLGGLFAYNYSVTGRPQNLGKAIVRHFLLDSPQSQTDAFWPGQVRKRKPDVRGTRQDELSAPATYGRARS